MSKTKKLKLPKEVNVGGIIYKIEYVEKPSDVDAFKRESLWGQIDPWTRTIRVYTGNDRPVNDIWHTIFHEIIHAIVYNTKISIDHQSTEGEKIVDILSLQITDILVRNNWMSI